MNIFIPIKQNSQRVPRKNFRLFNGEPLYKHTLLKYPHDNVYVDTDSNEIYDAIKSDERLLNVEVFKRNPRLIGDTVSVCDLIKNFIHTYQIEGPIVQIHVTSPFLLYKTVKDGYNMICEHDSVVACNVHQTRLWRKEEYGFCPINHNPLRLEQTQDLPKCYEENSAFYIFQPNIIIETGNRVGKNPHFFEVKEPENLDIDTEEDWQKIIRLC